MMGEILSLKLHRKRQARAAKEAEAAENRARSGLSKAEKTQTLAEADKARSDLDGHKREP